MYITKYYTTRRLSSGRNILVNTLTGSIDYISDSLMEQLSGEPGESIRAGSLEEVMLKQKGYIFDSSSEEKELVDTIYQKEKELLEQKPYVFVFCLTYACNLKCFYCFEDNYHQIADVLDQEDMETIIAFIEQILGKRKQQEFRVVLEGGEPFLDHREEIISYFFERMNQLGKKYEGFKGVSVFTNGENTLAYLGMLKKYQQIIEKVMITLAGTEEIHNTYRFSGSPDGNYKNAVHTTAVLLENGVRVLTVLNLDKNNIQCLPEISKEIERYQWNKKKNYMGCYVSRIKYFAAAHLENAISEWEILQAVIDFAGQDKINGEQFNLGDLKLLKNIGSLIRYGSPQFFNCAASSRKQYLFGPDGLLYNCTKVTAQETYAIGSYHEEPAIKEEKVKWWTEGALKENLYCMDCKYAFICGGKCRYAEDRIGFRPDVCKKDTEKLLSLFLDHLEAGEHFVQKDVIYEN